jgi:ABC-2 type transport system ATP-binding protein
MKQRVGIAKTLLHDPQLLILDEPAATIDPRARILMRGLLRQLADLGKAVLVSSHILPELADVCDTVGILQQGRLVACGGVQQILNEVRQARLMEIRVLGDIDKAREALKAAPGAWNPVDSVPVGQAASKEKTLRYEVQADEQQLAKAVLMLLQNKIAVTHFAEVPADLEDVFMSLTK